MSVVIGVIGLFKKTKNPFQSVDDTSEHHAAPPIGSGDNTSIAGADSPIPTSSRRCGGCCSNIDFGRAGDPDSACRRLRGSALIVCYFLVGAIYYANAETEWDAHTTFYFTSISISTVGYGDFTPKTKKDKWFTIVFISIGLLFIYSYVTASVDYAFTMVDERIKLKVLEMQQNQHSTSTSTSTDLNSIKTTPNSTIKPTFSNSIPADDSDVDQALRYNWLFYLTFALCLQVCGGLAICVSEEDWTIADGLYWAFETSTTLGFGDMPLRKQSRIFAGLYALFSVGTLARSFTGIAAARKEAYAEKRYRKLMRRALDRELITAFDKNGKGVSRSEFLMGMLVAMDVVLEKECLEVLTRFDELDTDKSGHLDTDDLQRIAQSLSRGLSFKLQKKKRGGSSPKDTPKGAPNGSPNPLQGEGNAT